MTSLDVERFEVEASEAAVTRPPRAPGGVALMPSAFLHAGLPLKDPGPGADWVRASRTVTLRLRPGIGPSGEPIGLPFGSVARLLVSWVTTEAMKTRSPEIRLGVSVGTFLSSLGFEARAQSGGDNGTIARVKEQARRLFSCSATIDRQRDENTEPVELWKASPALIVQPIGSVLTLSEVFMTEIANHAVPADQATVLGLSRSALSMDIYWWLSWRFSFLQGDQKVSWEQLQQQFGSRTELTRKFKQTFTFALERVRAVYPDSGLV